MNERDYQQDHRLVDQTEAEGWPYVKPVFVDNCFIQTKRFQVNPNVDLTDFGRVWVDFSLR